MGRYLLCHMHPWSVAESIRTGVPERGLHAPAEIPEAEWSAQPLVYANLAREVQVAIDTAKRWTGLLTGIHCGFLVRPWFKIVAKALRKEPKWYLRDWSGVDFLIVRDRKPWFLVEAKLSDTRLSASLGYYQRRTKVPHAFQVVLNLPYEPADCFATHQPVVVPGRTFLSQLL
jgi:hypothetical protein